MTTSQHSFQHFSWLHGCLVTKYGSVVVIPPIPESVLYGDLEDELIEKRRIGFQKFASRICRHPVLSNSEAWKLFITETHDKVRYSKDDCSFLSFLFVLRNGKTEKEKWSWMLRTMPKLQFFRKSNPPQGHRCFVNFDYSHILIKCLNS